MNVIFGKAIAKEILKNQQAIIETQKIKPRLVTILIGDNEASKIYISEKKKKAKRIGVEYENYHLKRRTGQKKVIDILHSLNNDGTVHGVLVQFPIPSHLDADEIVRNISPKKDADGFHRENIKKFLKLKKPREILKAEMLLPVTPAAIIEVLNRVRLPKIVSIGIISKPSVFITPLIHYFKLKGRIEESGKATSIAILSPDDANLEKKSSACDVLIVACGRPKFVTASMVKHGAVVIDVGISRQNGKVVGDVDFEHVLPKTSYITPVTGGVGPVTVAVLMRNVVYAALKDKYDKS